MTRVPAALLLVALVACGSEPAIDPDAIEIIPTDQFTIDEINGQVTFVATAVLDSDEGRFTVEITRDGDLTQSRIVSASDDAPDATVVARGTETYALVDGSWITVDEFGAAGLVLLLAAPDVAHQMAVEIRQTGTFAGWEDVDGQAVARFDVAEIPETVRSEFYTVTGGSGSMWLTEAGLPIRWTATAPDGVGALEWTLTDLGGPVEIDLPPQFGG